jgi:hypothetical protein
MGDMALLVGNDSRIEGDQSDMLHVLFGAMVNTLEAETKLTQLEADRLALVMLVRVQSRLAAAGYIVRDV